MPNTREQLNPYKGSLLRAWMRIALADDEGVTEESEAVVDTGSPYPVIIGADRMARFSRRKGGEVITNFGPMQSYWGRVQVSEIGFDETILGFASDNIVRSVKSSSDDFEGLIGLPFLRLTTCGGDHKSFWIRPANELP